MMPSDVEARVKAQTQLAQDKFLGWFGTAFIIAAWLAIGIGLVLYLDQTETPPRSEKN